MNRYGLCEQIASGCGIELERVGATATLCRVIELQIGSLVMARLIGSYCGTYLA